MNSCSTHMLRLIGTDGFGRGCRAGAASRCGGSQACSAPLRSSVGPPRPTPPPVRTPHRHNHLASHLSPLSYPKKGGHRCDSGHPGCAVAASPRGRPQHTMPRQPHARAFRPLAGNLTGLDLALWRTQTLTQLKAPAAASYGTIPAVRCLMCTSPKPRSSSRRGRRRSTPCR
eukprot:COSAG06_NODE_321_length_17580_cov_10.920313_2_plen_172_part_00